RGGCRSRPAPQRVGAELAGDVGRGEPEAAAQQLLRHPGGPVDRPARRRGAGDRRAGPAVLGVVDRLELVDGEVRQVRGGGELLVGAHLVVPPRGGRCVGWGQRGVPSRYSSGVLRRIVGSPIVRPSARAALWTSIAAKIAALRDRVA